jgi:hypothetical protein
MDSDLPRPWLRAVVELAHDGWTVVPTPSLRLAVKKPS